MKIYLLFFSFLLYLSIHGQIEIKHGDWTKRKLGTIHLDFVLADSSNVYTINDRNLGSPSISVFDKNTLDFHYDIPVKTDPAKESLTHIFSMQKSIFTIVEEKNQESQVIIMLNRIDLKGEITQKTSLDTLPDQDLRDAYEIVVNKNEDALLYIKQGSIKSQNHQKIELKSFNSSMQETWSKEIIFQDKEKHYLLTNWSFTGKDKLSFTGRAIMDVYKPESEYSATNQNIHFLFNYNQKEDKFREIEISLYRKFIDKIAFKQNDSTTLVSGFFSNDKNFKTDGVFTLTFDEQFNRKSHSLHQFSNEELKHFSSNVLKSQLKKNNSKRNYVNELLLHDLLILESGEYVLLAEEFRKEWEDPLNTVKQEVLKPSSFLYYYQNIHAVWIKRNGDFNNIQSVQKNQLARDGYNKHNSFQSAQSKDKVYLFFNENPKNRERPNAMHLPISVNKKMFVQSIRLQSDRASIKKLITPPSKKTKVSVTLGGQLSDNIVYFLSQKGIRKKAVVKIDLRE